MSMIESKKSFKHFSKSSVEEEQSIAKMDQNVYSYFLSKYVA